MAVDRRARKLESDLRRIIRSYGISVTNIDGVEFVGICATRQVGDKGGAYVPSTPKAVAVSIPELARQISECLP